MNSAFLLISGLCVKQYTTELILILEIGKYPHFFNFYLLAGIITLQEDIQCLFGFLWRGQEICLRFENYMVKTEIDSHHALLLLSNKFFGQSNIVWSIIMMNTVLPNSPDIDAEGSIGSRK